MRSRRFWPLGSTDPVEAGRLIEVGRQAELDQKNRHLFEGLDRELPKVAMSVRTANCLNYADLHYIGELVQRAEADMLKTKNFGRKSLKEIKAILEEFGLRLGMRDEIVSWGWTPNGAAARNGTRPFFSVR
ncbi:hypothetical protein EXS71_01400 [Candidatus Uhrbacteria bacterium]|nr:hypothetical protein [Candidatus Uhrbacteria bacterium]